jgi:hypothetical protein
MPGDGRLTPKLPALDGRGGMPPGRVGAPVPGLAAGPLAGRGGTDACEVKGLLPMRGGPEVARGTAGPGRGAGRPAAGRAAPGAVGRVAVAESPEATSCGAAGGARNTSALGAEPATVGAGVAGATGDTGAAAAAGAGATTGSAARGLSAVRAVARAAAAGGAAGAAAGFGNDSRSLRTTGASMVEDAERTNSPNS